MYYIYHWWSSIHNYQNFWFSNKIISLIGKKLITKSFKLVINYYALFFCQKCMISYHTCGNSYNYNIYYNGVDMILTLFSLLPQNYFDILSHATTRYYTLLHTYMYVKVKIQKWNNICTYQQLHAYDID